MRRVVQLIAKRNLKARDPVTLDYADHPLQHMLRQYGFVPNHPSGAPVHEVFEEFGSTHEALIVQATPQVNCYAVSKARRACAVRDL